MKQGNEGDCHRKGGGLIWIRWPGTDFLKTRNWFEDPKNKRES